MGTTLTLPPPLDPVSFLPREEEVDNILNVLGRENLFGFNLLTPGVWCVGAAGPHFIRAYAKFQNVNHRLETLRAPGGGWGEWVGVLLLSGANIKEKGVGWSCPLLRGNPKC
jgi:hypothetical protein